MTMIYVKFQNYYISLTIVNDIDLRVFIRKNNNAGFVLYSLDSKLVK